MAEYRWDWPLLAVFLVVAATFTGAVRALTKVVAYVRERLNPVHAAKTQR
jgi:hypothetical protein